MEYNFLLNIAYKGWLSVLEYGILFAPSWHAEIVPRI
jgi:hypothetical protein